MCVCLGVCVGVCVGVCACVSVSVSVGTYSYSSSNLWLHSFLLIDLEVTWYILLLASSLTYSSRGPEANFRTKVPS